MKEHSEDLGDKEWLWFKAQSKQMKNSVFRIVKEVAEGHANGTAKHWAEGLFELVTILLETDFEGEEKIWVHSSSLYQVRKNDYKGIENGIEN